MYQEHFSYIRQSIALAMKARENGNHPFGALLVKEGQIIYQAENIVLTENDPTKHAELNLVSQAHQQLGSLAGTTLYTSTEPCLMCTGAIYWADISKIVYSVSAATLEELAKGGIATSCKNILAQGTKTIEVIGPVLEEEGIKAHIDFWPRN